MTAKMEFAVALEAKLRSLMTPEQRDYQDAMIAAETAEKVLEQRQRAADRAERAYYTATDTEVARRQIEAAAARVQKAEADYEAALARMKEAEQAVLNQAK